MSYKRKRSDEMLDTILSKGLGYSIKIPFINKNKYGIKRLSNGKLDYTNANILMINRESFKETKWKNEQLHNLNPNVISHPITGEIIPIPRTRIDEKITRGDMKALYNIISKKFLNAEINLFSLNKT
jgi:hypothetical protein